MEKHTAKRRLIASHGAVLLLALVFILMLAMVAATVMQTAILQLHMAGNDQFLEEALHKAHAIATELSLDADNFSLEGGVGSTNCPLAAQAPGCDRSQLQAPTSAAAPAGTLIDYRVTRQDPLLARGFPLRESQDTVSSSTSFDAAIFEIDVHIDGGAKRLGSAHIVQGIAVRVAASR
jgi:hypothetical protein